MRLLAATVLMLASLAVSAQCAGELNGRYAFVQQNGPYVLKGHLVFVNGNIGTFNNQNDGRLLSYYRVWSGASNCDSEVECAGEMNYPITKSDCLADPDQNCYLLAGHMDAASLTCEVFSAHVCVDDNANLACDGTPTFLFGDFEAFGGLRTAGGTGSYGGAVVIWRMWSTAQF